jgi:hypothetical protein
MNFLSQVSFWAGLLIGIVGTAMIVGGFALWALRDVQEDAD